VETLKDLTGKEESDILETKYIYELRSMSYLNLGTSFSSQPLPTNAQLSTIEDIHVDDTNIVFTGNYYGFVTELGECSSNAGGVISLAEENSNVQNLNLPKSFSGRKIIKLDENNLLFVPNNGDSFIVNYKNQ
jgi:hypothetical protein